MKKQGGLSLKFGLGVGPRFTPCKLPTHKRYIYRERERGWKNRDDELYSGYCASSDVKTCARWVSIDVFAQTALARAPLSLPHRRPSRHRTTKPSKHYYTSHPKGAKAPIYIHTKHTTISRATCVCL